MAEVDTGWKLLGRVIFVYRFFDHGDRFGGLLIGYVGLITVPVVYN